MGSRVTLRRGLDGACGHEPRHLYPTSPPRPGFAPRNGMALERRDLDRAAGLIPTFAAPSLTAMWSSSGRRAAADGRCRYPVAPLAALDRTRCPASTRRCCSPHPEGGLLNLDNFRRREWDPADRGRRRSRGPPASTTCGQRRVERPRGRGDTCSSLAKDHGLVSSGDRAPLRRPCSTVRGPGQRAAGCARGRTRGEGGGRKPKPKGGRERLARERAAHLGWLFSPCP